MDISEDVLSRSPCMQYMSTQSPLFQLFKGKNKFAAVKPKQDIPVLTLLTIGISAFKFIIQVF